MEQIKLSSCGGVCKGFPAVCKLELTQRRIVYLTDSVYLCLFAFVHFMSAEVAVTAAGCCAICTGVPSRQGHADVLQEYSSCTSIFCHELNCVSYMHTSCLIRLVVEQLSYARNVFIAACPMCNSVVRFTEKLVIGNIDNKVYFQNNEPEKTFPKAVCI